MKLFTKTIEFTKDGVKREMNVLYTVLVVNGKSVEVQLELYQKNNFVRSLLVEEIKKSK